MKKKRVSIVDIANSLQISKTTISFILNGKAKEKRISDDMVAKVNQFIRETGYKPSALARSLRTGRSKIIGFLIEDISHPFFSSIARLIEDEATKNGYKIIYASTDNDILKTREIITMMRDRQVDGYIITPPLGIESEVTELIGEGIPVVVFDRYLPGVKTDYVVVDNFHGAFGATTHLLDQGYRNVVFVTFRSLQMQMQDRESGYSEAMKSRKLTPVVLELEYSHSGIPIMEALTDLLPRQTNMDAVLFATNRIGVCGLKVMEHLGKNMKDIAIASFDDDIVYKFHKPSVTAVAQPIEKIAHNVISLMITKLKKRNQSPDFQTVILDTALKVRDSTKAKKIA
jgi:LacI family transcriptional regulator